MIVQPSLGRTNPPSLEQMISQLKRDVLKSINCARIGEIQAFDAGAAGRAATATVKIAQQQVTSVSPEGVRTMQEFPLLLKVPVIFPSGGGFTLTFPIAEGDECLVVFNDRELDNWLFTGPGSTPTTGRVHDLSDGIAIMGLRSNLRALANISTNSTQLRSDDGQSFVEVGSGVVRILADQVIIHGRTRASFDAGGNGFVYTPTTIDTYSDGVPATAHPPAPPGPP